MRGAAKQVARAEVAQAEDGHVVTATEEPFAAVSNHVPVFAEGQKRFALGLHCVVLDLVLVVVGGSGLHVPPVERVGGVPVLCS